MIKDLELSGIEDEKARAEIQRLRDENSRLKGEQGKPKVKGAAPA